MRILSKIDTSREGNDCWIDESYALILVFGEKYVIKFFTENEELKNVIYKTNEISRFKNPELYEIHQKLIKLI